MQIRTEDISTDYGTLVVRVFEHMKGQTAPGAALSIDQGLLRQCLALSSSHLVADATTSPVSTADGINKWLVGFTRLVDVVVALHNTDELELETINVASKACSECWSVAGSLRGLEDGRDGVRSVAGKLKRVLDENGKTYKGERVWAP